MFPTHYQDCSAELCIWKVPRGFVMAQLDGDNLLCYTLLEK